MLLLKLNMFFVKTCFVLTWIWHNATSPDRSRPSKNDNFNSTNSSWYIWCIVHCSGAWAHLLTLCQTPRRLPGLNMIGSTHYSEICSGFGCEPYFKEYNILSEWTVHLIVCSFWSCLEAELHYIGTLRNDNWRKLEKVRIILLKLRNDRRSHSRQVAG